MNLTPCRECGKNISRAAAICPYCGKRLRMHGCFKTILIIAGIIFSVIWLFWNIPTIMGHLANQQPSTVPEP